MEERINVNGVEYVRADDVAELRPQSYSDDGRPYVIARCRDAGVHAGYLVAHPVGTREATLRDARRLWRWNSSGTLTGLANDGPIRPGDCRFSPAGQCDVTLLDVAELLGCTESATSAIQGVQAWTAK